MTYPPPGGQRQGYPQGAPPPPGTHAHGGPPPPPGAPPPSYGAPPPPMYGGPVQKTPGGAIASLVLGIVGIVLTFFSGGICAIVVPITSIIGIVLGVKARGTIKKNPREFKGGGMAMAGIIINAILLVLGILGILFWVLYMVLYLGFLFSV